MEYPMMKCGHAANAVIRTPGEDDKPVCFICSSIHEGWDVVDEDAPSLNGREAECSCCSKKVPSSPELAFFEYRGEGSRASRLCKRCGYTEETHERMGGKGNGCSGYVPYGPWEYDRYYSGCKGWD